MFLSTSILVVSVHILLFVVALFMGALVLVHNQKSATNQIFAMMAVAIIFWDIANLLSFSLTNLHHEMIAVRLVMLFAGAMLSLVFLFSLVFPREDTGLTFFKSILLHSVLLVFSAVGFFVFADPDFSTLTNMLGARFDSAFVVFGNFHTPLLPFWGIFSILLPTVSAGVLLVKLIKTTGEEREGRMIVLLSVALTFLLLPLLLFIPPALFKVNIFVPLAPIVYLPMFLGIGYAILKHHVFNVKIIFTEFLIFALMLLLFIAIFV